MSKSSFPESRAAESWAEVRARDQVVRYRRSGMGRSVLVLVPPDHPDALWPDLLQGLSAAFRLIVPDPPAAERDAAAWLATFLEGLGLSNVGIVAAGCFCIPVLELAFLDADQLAEFREAMEPVYTSWADTLGQDVVDEFEQAANGG
jgi:hypothetical protein